MRRRRTPSAASAALAGAGADEDAGGLADVGHRADDGDAGVALDVLRRADPTVEQAADDGVAEPEQGAEHGAEEHVALDLRRHRARRELCRLRHLDAHALVAAGLAGLDALDPLRERAHPRVGELLRLLGRAGACGDRDDDGVGRLGGVDAADQALGRGVEPEVVDDERRGLAVLRQHDVRRRARLGQRVVEAVEARVATATGGDEARRARGIDLGLDAAPPEGGQRGHQDERRHGDPVVAQDAQVVGELHRIPFTFPDVLSSVGAAAWDVPRIGWSVGKYNIHRGNPHSSKTRRNAGFRCIAFRSPGRHESTGSGRGRPLTTSRWGHHNERSAHQSVTLERERHHPSDRAAWGSVVRIGGHGRRGDAEHRCRVDRSPRRCQRLGLTGASKDHSGTRHWSLATFDRSQTRVGAVDDHLTADCLAAVLGRYRLRSTSRVNEAVGPSQVSTLLRHARRRRDPSR